MVRKASFNLAHLEARAERCVEKLYGKMSGHAETDHESESFLVRREIALDPGGSPVALEADERPQLLSFSPSDEPILLELPRRAPRRRSLPRPSHMTRGDDPDLARCRGGASRQDFQAIFRGGGRYEAARRGRAR